MKSLKAVIILLSLSVLNSCSSTLKVRTLDPNTGKFPTDSGIFRDEILVDSRIDLSEFSEFLYIQENNVNMSKYDTYIEETLKNIGYFKHFYTTEELERYIIENNLTDKVTSISDNIGLLHLQKEVGNFLVCETNVEALGGYNYSFRFTIINPAKSEKVLDIEHKAFNWSGLDRPLFNPVFNYYIDWLKRNSQ